MITESTNKVFNLEDDLMPFIYKEVEKKEPEKNAKKDDKKDSDEKKEKARTPNFFLTEKFNWIVEARQQIKEIYEENIKGPLELLAKYKEYEYILNVDKVALVKKLFREEKAPLETLREEISHYEKAQQDILNISNDVVDFPLFRIQAQNLKQNLSRQAEKIKELSCSRRQKNTARRQWSTFTRATRK